jgi:pimeloyl-ACP methyl ester carboxylesterase
LSFLLFFAASIELNAQGSYSVGHTSRSFFDDSRGRNVPTEIYYPAPYSGADVPLEGSAHPLLVFGHGFLMEWQAYQNLWEHFVPQGYIMAFPRTETGTSPDHGVFAEDLRFVSDRLYELADSTGTTFFGKLSSKWALIGHSMGGGAAFLAASGDSTVSSLIAFAPAETTPSAIDSSASLQAPLLVFSGEQDGVTPPPDHHLPLYDSSASDCKFFISILGGAHCYFAEPNTYCDLGEANASTGISVTRSEQQQIAYHFADPWMAAVLQGDPSAFSTFEDRTMNDGSIAYYRTCSMDPTSLQATASEGLSVRVHPNPVRDRVHLILPEGQRIERVRLYSIRGATTPLKGRVVNDKTFDLEGLRKGVYFLKVRSQGGEQGAVRFLKR